MATAPRETSTHQRDGGRDGGRGGGGKIRKNTYRNTQATPYDRPLTALRNSNNSVRNTNGWLSRLVDPASKLITASARKILSSVFTKRMLPSTAPKPPASDVVLESTDKHQGTSSMVHSMAEQNNEDVACGHPTLDIDNITELEQMLKQKRFTRYEIDRLTTLLRSRTVNGSIRGEEGNPYIKVANEQALKHHAHTPQKTPVIPVYRRNGYITTPTTGHRVFDEDITSPLELAKVYMSTRASKFTPPTSDSRGLTLNSWTPSYPILSKSLIESRNLDTGLESLNSVSQATMSNSGSDLRKFAYGEPSYKSSGSQHRVSGFKNASLKRRSSVLQDQYGSIGSIRRVRQKLNLLNSKGMDALVRESSPPISRSKDKTIAISDTRTSNLDPAPTHFNEVAQQTAPLLGQSVYPQNEAISDEILGSSAAKSPAALTSASETRASLSFRNLEKGESSGIIKDAQLDNTMDDPRDTLLCDAGYSAMKDSMTSKNGPTKLNRFSTEKISDTKLMENTLAEATSCDGKNSGVGSLPKKHAFRMSILEDFIDIDEDDAECALGHSISATPNVERDPLMSSGGVPLPDVSTDVNEVPSAVLSSGRSTMGGVMGLKNSDEPMISEKSTSFRDSVGPSSLSSQSAIPIRVSKLSTETSLKGKDDALLASDYSLKTPDRASSPMLNSSPIVANASSGLKPQAPSDSKLEASRFGSGPADVDRTSKQSEGDKISVSPEARHLFSKPQADPVASAPALETTSIFSFGNAANNKGSPFNSSSGSSLHSTALHSNLIGDTKQNNLPATYSTIVGSNNGQTCASDYGGDLTNFKDSTNRSDMAPSTPSSAPMTGSSGTANNTAASLNCITTPAQLHAPGMSTEMNFSSPSSASTSSLFGSMAPTVKASDRDSSSAPVMTSFAASSTSASSMNTTTSFISGASSTAAISTGFTFGATTTPGQRTAANTNTGFATGSSLTPITFGVASTSGPTTSATTSTGFVFGGSSTPATDTSGCGISFGTSAAAVNTTSTAGVSVGVSSASATTNSGLLSGALSTPASTSSLFSFGASSTPATSSGFSFGASSTLATSSGFSFGASSTPATSIGFPFGGAATPASTTSSVSGASSTPATTNSVFPFGGSSAPATNSSGFSFGASSTPATSDSVFPFGGSSSPANSSVFSFGVSSTPAVNTTSAGIPSTMASSPAAKTTNSGFSFGAPSSTGATAFLAASSSPTGVTTSAFLFGASSTSTPVTSTAGFPSTSSSAHAAGSGLSFGASSTPNPFSFGAASTPATSTANNGSPFGFTAQSSAYPFSAGTANNTSPAQPLFGNTNPFSSTAAVNNNIQTSMEDSMAEDSVQASVPALPAFGAPNTSGFGFGAPNPSGTSNSFQFAGQPNPSNPFQSSGSLGGFTAGGSFSLGSGGDKSNRRIIKPKKGRRK